MGGGDRQTDKQGQTKTETDRDRETDKDRQTETQREKVGATYCKSSSNSSTYGMQP